MLCTRCDGTGFLNIEQVDARTLDRYERTNDPQVILDWIEEQDSRRARLGGCTCHISPPCSYCTLLHDVASVTVVAKVQVGLETTVNLLRSVPNEHH